MTDENTRQPSDSVVEALKEARAIAHTASKGITMQRDWLLEKRDQFDATLQALAAQPRDDVREASTYERLGQMLRREKLKPTARFLEAAYLGYNLCRMERDGRIARNEGSGTGSAI